MAGTSRPRKATLDVIKRAFERAGVDLIDEDGGVCFRDANLAGVRCSDETRADLSRLDGGDLVLPQRLEHISRVFAAAPSSENDQAT